MILYFTDASEVLELTLVFQRQLSFLPSSLSTYVQLIGIFPLPDMDPLFYFSLC